MSTALSSLAALHGHHHHHSNDKISSNSSSTDKNENSNTNMTIDARNVRNAIEEDALHQARLLENELKHLVSMVGTMRQSIKEVVTVAECVGKGLETGVMDDSSVITGTATEEKEDQDNNNNSLSSFHSNSDDAFEQERKLAQVIADAFKDRDEATKRFNAISEFLEKYDLDEKDSQLLESYNFEDVLLERDADNHNSKKMVRFGSLDNNNENDEYEHIKDGMTFLAALQRVTKIRKELTSTSDRKNSTVSHLGISSTMRMVENLASKQERAFERLYHFLHARLDLHQSAKMAHVPTSSTYTHQPRSAMEDDDDAMDEVLGHPFIRQALTILQHVPAYYAHTLEMIADSRRSEVTRKFLLALTNSYNGMAPIEMKAHDPVNYVGDMLAFVFRTISVESELARGLATSTTATDDNDFVQNDHDDKECVDNVDDGDNSGISFMSTHDVLNNALGGVARPLKSRISQVIGSLARRLEEDEFNDGFNGNNGFMEDEADTPRQRLSYLFSICGLLLFYRSAIQKVANKMTKETMTTENGNPSNQANPLVECLEECLEEGAKAYVASLKVYCATLDHLASVSSETQAYLCKTVILRLCDVRLTSPGFGPDAENAADGISDDAMKALSMDYLCETLIEAVLPVCSDIDDIVAIRSALSAAKKNGLTPESASRWEESVAKEEEKMIDAQIVRDTNYVLDDCGLGSIASALEGMKAVYIEGMVVSSHPGLSQQSLEVSMKKFYTSLIDLPLPSYENVKDPVLKKRSKNRIAQNVADMYEEIYTMVTSEQGGYSDLSFMVNDPVQVRALVITP
jgi:hypothetical protein